jgi:aspartate/glutamate/glutamine transport system ATP-binding protein
LNQSVSQETAASRRTRLASMITFSGVSKSFGDLRVLSDIDLTIERGEVVVVIGPSGSGKSTLIRCINRLETVDAGSVVVAGVHVEDPKIDIARVRREVGMVFQGFNLYPHLTVLENIMLAPVTVKRVARDAAEATARTLLERVGIPEKATVYPAQLSGGQQQRVAIARALAMEPQVLLFDEPTSALDPEMIGEVLDVIRTLAHTGITMVIVTHEMGFAREVADRIVFMDDGRILEIEPPQTFFAQPRHERARAFLSKLLSAASAALPS